MNKKGQVTVALLLTLFIGVVVALAIITPIFQNQGTLTDLGNSSNVSYTMPTNGTTSDLTACGQLNTSAVVIYNYTNNTGDVGGANAKIGDGNYTITQAIGSTGYIATRIYWDTLAVGYMKAGYKANVSCIYEPTGYLHDSSSRNITELWGIMAVLALVAFVLAGVKYEWFD